jgi:prevent-host-death family protein
MKAEVDAHDARARLPELLRQVKAGKRFTIIYRGEAIADLVPREPTHAADAGAAIDRFQTFMREHPVASGAIDIKALIEEGRSAGVRPCTRT